MNESNLNISSLLRFAIERHQADVHTALPARVESYDPATQTVNVQPLLKDRYEDETGTMVAERLPVIQNVPVMFPGAGGMRITFPLAAGDTVLLVFSERSLDKWQSQGGEVEDLRGWRMHNLSDAIAIPGLHSNNMPWTDASTSCITLGSDSGAAEWVATGDRVLSALQDFATKFNGHTHTVATAPGPSGPPTAAAVPTTIVPPSTVASATVKIKG